MTQRTVKTIRSECGRIVVAVRFDSEWEEYRVSLRIDGVYCSAATYHTSDKGDAIATANVMLQSALNSIPQLLAII